MSELVIAEKDAEIARLQTELAKKESELKEKEDEAENSSLGDGGKGPLGATLPPTPGKVPYYYTINYYVDPNKDTVEPVPAPSDPVNEHCESALKSKSSQEDDDPVCANIPEACASTLHEYFWKIPPPKEVVAALKECECPENCDTLKPLEINEEVKTSMKSDDVSKDSTMKYICLALVKAAQLLAAAWGELMTADAHLQRDMNLTSDDEKKIACPNGHSINMTKIAQLIQQGLQVLGMGSVQCNQKRRLDLKYKLVNSAKELADKNQPMGPLLFGDNLKEHYRQIQEKNRLTNITVNKKPRQSLHKFHPYPAPFLARPPGPQWSQWHQGQQQQQRPHAQGFMNYPPGIQHAFHPHPPPFRPQHFQQNAFPKRGSKSKNHRGK